MQLNDQNFIQEIENYQGVALVDFFAPWCGPCLIMEPILEQLIKDYKDKSVKIAKINIDENQQTAEKYQIASIPTFILFKQGKIEGKIIGYSTIEEIRLLIDKSI